MGMWDQDGLNSHPTKLNHMIDMLESSLGHATTDNLSPSTTIHHQNRGDCHFQSSQYLTPLPNLGGDPYSSAECQQIDLDGFTCPSSADNNFHKCKFRH